MMSDSDHAPCQFIHPLSQGISLLNAARHNQHTNGLLTLSVRLSLHRCKHTSAFGFPRACGGWRISQGASTTPVIEFMMDVLKVEAIVPQSSLRAGDVASSSL
jgi:hypothetical protein